MNTVERMARAMARGLGDDFDNAFANKGEWNAARGEKGGRYRDINEPMQPDYIEAARAALAALREPSPGMVEVGWNNIDWARSHQMQTCPSDKRLRATGEDDAGSSPAEDMVAAWQAMIDQAIREAGQ